VAQGAPGDSEPPAPESKERLERQKLALEAQLLARQLSWRGQLATWIQAASIPAAVAGLIVSFLIGSSQLQLTENAQIDSRLDKDLTRIQSSANSDRFAGVSDLFLFVERNKSSRRSDAIDILVGALANETDPVIQSKILRVITDLRVLGVDSSVIDSSLRSVLENSNSLTTWLNAQNAPTDAALRRYIARKQGLRADELEERIPDTLLALLTTGDYRAMLPIQQTFVERISGGDAIRLKGLARAISAMIQQGAHATDFSGIFCEDCDFTPAKDLSGATFDNAYLARANFSHMLLKHTSFRDADLGNTYFFAANLDSADLSSVDPKSATRWNQIVAGTYRSLPLLDCAVLDGSDLTRLPLVVAQRVALTGHDHTLIFATVLRSASTDTSPRGDLLGVILEQTAREYALDAHPFDVVAMSFDGRIENAARGQDRGVYRYDDHPAGESNIPREFLRTVIAFGTYDLWGRKADGSLFVSGTTPVADVDSTLNGFLPGYVHGQHLESISNFAELEHVQGQPAQSVSSIVPTSANICSQAGHPSLQSLVIYPDALPDLFR